MAINGDGEFQAMQARLADLLPRLNERDRRLTLATEAKSWGRGGISAVHQATGASRTTIRHGITELADNSEERSSDRVRAPGGGRKKSEVANPELVDVLDGLIEPETPGRSRIAVAVDHEIDAPPRRGAERYGSLRQPRRRRANPPLPSLQLTRHSQETG